ncbi:hypothetical protein PM1_015 [Pectobacterium phage PM1]|uniref:Uncharacterized protein n=1 Tax=Pectobacterium phage PM1 TaxID=1399915 RepID=X2CSV1_9CAUD|nr:hypothetical protein PM1_015 [Pectobacterium phage PM1]AGV99231.1 hypothetical protein PM1_015 [Pectobacterium phage PM1]
MIEVTGRVIERNFEVTRVERSTIPTHLAIKSYIPDVREDVVGRISFDICLNHFGSPDVRHFERFVRAVELDLEETLGNCRKAEVGRYINRTLWDELMKEMYQLRSENAILKGQIPK